MHPASLATWTVAVGLALLEVRLARRFPGLPDQAPAPEAQPNSRLNWRFMGMLLAAAPLLLLTLLADLQAGPLVFLLGMSVICLLEVNRLARKEGDAKRVLSSIETVHFTSFALLPTIILGSPTRELGFGAGALKLTAVVLVLGVSSHIALKSRSSLKFTIVIGLLGSGFAALAVHSVTTPVSSTPIDFTLPAAILLHLAAWLFVESRAQPLPRYLRSQVRF